MNIIKMLEESVLGLRRELSLYRTAKEAEIEALELLIGQHRAELRESKRTARERDAAADRARKAAWHDDVRRARAEQEQAAAERRAARLDPRTTTERNRALADLVECLVAVVPKDLPNVRQKALALCECRYPILNVNNVRQYRGSKDGIRYKFLVPALDAELFKGVVAQMYKAASPPVQMPPALHKILDDVSHGRPLERGDPT